MENEVLQEHSFYQYSDVEILFTIKTKELDLQAISEFLNLNPTRGFSKGDVVLSKQLNTVTAEVETIKRKRPYTLFAYETRHFIRSKQFQDHAKHLLNKLEGVKNNLKDFLLEPHKFEILIQVNLSIDKEETYFGFTPDLTTLKKLTDYCHLIEFNGKLK